MVLLGLLVRLATRSCPPSLVVLAGFLLLLQGWGVAGLWAKAVLDLTALLLWNCVQGSTLSSSVRASTSLSSSDLRPRAGRQSDPWRTVAPSRTPSLQSWRQRSTLRQLCPLEKCLSCPPRSNVGIRSGNRGRAAFDLRGADHVGSGRGAICASVACRKGRRWQYGCFVVAVMKRQGGVLLALPVGVLAQEDLDAGNRAGGVLGYSHMVVLPSVILMEETSMQQERRSKFCFWTALEK